jgi:1-acyl-sn-glycerol-3-phosphate acyltransferase
MTALVQVLLVALVRLFVGVRALSPAELPPPPFVLFANHASHFDTLVLWAALDAERRAMLRPVAAADYWGKTRLHRWVAEQVLGALLIARKREDRTDDPVASMLTVLDGGKAILIFPEGTRSLDGRIAPFKAGLFQLATQRPQVPLVPVYLQNPGRILPKGEILPVPFLCSIRVGEPLSRESEETKDAFVARARQAVITLAGDAYEEEPST